MIHITTHSKGRKLDGIQSINTNSLTNKFCIKMHKKKDTVCFKCYSIRQLNYYGNMIKPLQNNSDVLSYAMKYYPVLNANIFRFNSFGELINLTHLANLNGIARVNPDTMFALWTKRAEIVNKYYSLNPKPDNMILIYSSHKVNKREELPEHFDKVFTVYNKWYASVNEIVINCAEKCMSCQLCYTKNTITHISELIK